MPAMNTLYIELHVDWLAVKTLENVSLKCDETTSNYISGVNPRKNLGVFFPSSPHIPPTPPQSFLPIPLLPNLPSPSIYVK